MAFSQVTTCWFPQLTKAGDSHKTDKTDQELYFFVWCQFTYYNCLSRLLEEVLCYINAVAHSVEDSADAPTAKFWRALLSKSYDVLDKVSIFFVWHGHFLNSLSYDSYMSVPLKFFYSGSCWLFICLGTWMLPVGIKPAGDQHLHVARRCKNNHLLIPIHTFYYEHLLILSMRISGKKICAG